MNLRLLVLGLLVTLAGPSLNAQQNAVNDHALLWRISGKDLKKPSYLFGTIHLICPDDYLWTGKMKACLDSSDKACFEIDLGDTSLKTKLMTSMANKDGKKLEDYFTPGDYATVHRYFYDSLDMDISRLQGMNPVILQSLVLFKAVGCAEPVSYEHRIMNTAQKENKKIMGLETVEEQMELLETMPPDKTIKGLVALAKGDRRMYFVYAALVKAYKNQDLPRLYKMITQSQHIDAMDAFLDERNKKWIVRMPGEMKQASVFFAVGAGHLPGENGVINLLRKAGYTVAPVSDTVNLPASSPQKEFTETDRKPQPGYNMNKYISENLHYPGAARKNHVEGRVLIKFVVNEDGAISDCTVVKGIGSGCDEEAVSVVKSMPAWKPGIKDGKTVKVYFTLPVVFSLGGDKPHDE